MLTIRYFSCFRCLKHKGQRQEKGRLQTDASDRRPIAPENLEAILYDEIQEENADSDFSQFDDSEADPNFVLEIGEHSDLEQSEPEAEDHSRIMEDADVSPEEPPDSGMLVDDSMLRQEDAVDNAISHTEVQPGPESSELIQRSYYGRNRYKWSSAEPIARTTRTQSHNIVHMSRSRAPSTYTNLTDLWELLFTNDMICLILTHTNEKIESYRTRCKDQNRPELRTTTEIELKVFFGLLFYSAVFKSNRENADYIFATDGTGREIFRCVMSKHRFLVLLHCLRFDDSGTRTTRLVTDKIAAISYKEIHTKLSKKLHTWSTCLYTCPLR